MISSRPISKNYPAGTALATMKGPIQGRNWYDLVNNITYSITQSGTGAVAIQGTNDVALRAVRPDEKNPVERAILPTDAATWTDILAATTNSSTGTFATAYQFVRIVVTTQGTGVVSQAYLLWN